MTPHGREPRAALRRTELREALPATADLLHRRRASEVGTDVIEDYVALDWLEWNGGNLRLTLTGQNICRQLTARLG